MGRTRVCKKESGLILLVRVWVYAAAARMAEIILLQSEKFSEARWQCTRVRAVIRARSLSPSVHAGNKNSSVVTMN